MISENQVPFSTWRVHLRLNKTLVQSYPWSISIAPSRFKSSIWNSRSLLFGWRKYCGAFQSLQLTTLSGWRKNHGKTMENIRRKMETSNLCHAPHLCHPAGATKPSGFGAWEHFSPCLFAQKMQSCQRANWDPASTTDFDFPFIKCSTLSCQLPLDTIIFSIFISIQQWWQSFNLSQGLHLLETASLVSIFNLFLLSSWLK